MMIGDEVLVIGDEGTPGETEAAEDLTAALETGMTGTSGVGPTEMVVA